MKTLMKMAGRIAPILFCCLVMGGCRVSNPFVTSLIFFPEAAFDYEPKDLNLDAETVRLKMDGNVELYSWYIAPQPGRPVLLYLHGNAGNISHRLSIAQGWASRGFGCFLLDYRGYGRSSGSIRHEKDMTDDARAAFRFLRDERRIPAERIVLYGESIGCAPALDLAVLERAGAVVLIAPFTRLIDMAHVHYGSKIPEVMLGDFKFDNESRIAGLKIPLFLMHGTADEIVPVEMGRRLFEKAPPPKESFWVDGGHHNDLPAVAGKLFWDRPGDFAIRSLSQGLVGSGP